MSHARRLTVAALATLAAIGALTAGGLAWSGAGQQVRSASVGTPQGKVIRVARPASQGDEESGSEDLGLPGVDDEDLIAVRS